MVIFPGICIIYSYKSVTAVGNFRRVICISLFLIQRGSKLQVDSLVFLFIVSKNIHHYWSSSYL